MAEDPIHAFDRAIKIGKPALLRLRADVLLNYDRDGKVLLTETEREELERIAVVPKDDDEDFLNNFDARLEAMDSEKDEE